ncbi:LuxR C-terminal-related transcriptional regulator [Dysosmobacter sp.]
MDQFVEIPAIQAKLKHSKNRIIYLHAVVGYGKTTAVKLFLKDTPHCYLSGEVLTKRTMPELSVLMKTMVVVDDVQWILDEEVRETIRTLCKQKKNRLILIGRGTLPQWLTDLALERQFLQCTSADLVFGERELTQMSEQMGLSLSSELLITVLSETLGNAMGIRLSLLHIEAGDDFMDERVQQMIWREYFDYLDQVCYARWEEELREILLPLGNFDSFSLEMAEQITGRHNMGRIIQYANTVAGFLCQRADGQWEMIPVFLQYLRYKCSMLYSQDDFKMLYRQAAAWYESQGWMEQALFFYEKAGDHTHLTKLLIKNALQHPGVADYYAFRQYYQSLSRELILKSPVLMSAMAMLHSIMLMPEEAEHWYSELKEYEKKPYRTNAERRDAKERLAYLEIALPHRGSEHMVEIIQEKLVLMTRGTLALPAFSVTGNLPSVMYGDKDFCEWSKIDSYLAVVLKEPLELVLGKAGKGLLPIALAESGFEKGTMGDYELQTRLSTGYMMAEAGGTLEMCFAAIGVLVRHHISKGQIDVAKHQLDSFRTKIEREQAGYLQENVNALSVWLSLLQGDQEAVKGWLSTTRDETAEFCTVSRYQFMQKLRCYLMLERYQDAVFLVEKLQFYFREYGRTHDLLECSLLKAILLYRTGISDWKQSLGDALDIAEKYHFVFAVAQEGSALLPLLNEMENEPYPFLNKVHLATERMAKLYPTYLKTTQQPMEALTEKEAEILKLLRQGFTTDRICEIAGITYNGLKFHNKNIYRKLGVRSRQEAVRRAVLLNL